MEDSLGFVHAAPAAAPPELDRLVHALEHALTAQDFHFERHPEYLPHVTLLRHVHCPDAELPALPPVTWTNEDFVLLQSVSSGNGVSYQVRARFPLY